MSTSLYPCASRQGHTIKYWNVRPNFCRQSWLRKHKHCYLYNYLHCVCHDLHENKLQFPCWPTRDTNSNTNPPRGEFINDSAHVNKQLVCYPFTDKSLARLTSRCISFDSEDIHFGTAVRHTSSHRTHVHTPNVMLPHHHIDFYIFNKF